MDTTRIQDTLITATAADTQASRREMLLGRYRVLARCGTGGFGTVCVCWDTRLQRRVAIKRMPLQVDSAGQALASTLDEALSEARTASLLAHPNIVTVFDFEVEGPFAYLVMEYVDGLNLSELLQRVEGGSLTPPEAAQVLKSVAEALAYAHENGALHLDIKPTNIMIDRNGVVKLADFGMATLASASGYGDARGGTVGYMPPEQIRGELVDERSDIFSLAVVMWLAITGENPFASTTAKNSMDRIERGPKPNIARLEPQLVGEADAAFMQAVSADPANRMSSVLSFAERVLPSLGDPERGRDSLSNLVDQSEEDETLSHETWAVTHVPFLDRFPWAETLFERALAALVSYLVSLPALTALIHPNAAFVCAALAALWPPLGSPLVLVAFIAATATVDQSLISLALLMLLAIAFSVWWLGFGCHDHLATPSLLLPICLNFPLGGSQLAGFALHPVPAFVTGAGSYLLYLLFSHISHAAFVGSIAAESLAHTLLLPQTWIYVLGCGLAALICAFITERGSVTAGVVGQIICSALLLGTQLVALRVENGGLWLEPPLDSVALALILCVLLCIATVLRGPLIWDQEGEGYEFS